MIKALLLLLFGGLKGAKLGTAGLSMLVSLALYARIWGWRYAAGVIASIFIHEMGHVIAARQRGLPVSAPAFIPFMGAFVTLRVAPRDLETQAYVALGGPLLGAVAAFGFYFAGQWSNDWLLLAIAHFGFVVNLFNLLPVSPLDGAKIAAVLSPRIRLVALALLAALLLYRAGPMAFGITLFAASQILRTARHERDTPNNGTYYPIPARKKFEYGAMYLGLAVTLAIMAYTVHANPGGGNLPSVWYPRSGG